VGKKHWKFSRGVLVLCCFRIKCYICPNICSKVPCHRTNVEISGKELFSEICILFRTNILSLITNLWFKSRFILIKTSEKINCNLKFLLLFCFFDRMIQNLRKIIWIRRSSATINNLNFAKTLNR